MIIPCYNYGRFLPHAVESALRQIGVGVEVIIVDDQSTDDSRDVARLLADAHPEVRVEVNPENSGHVRSFNAGWEAAVGDFVLKLDADDLLTPGALARAVALFEAHPSVGLVYGHPRHFSSEVPPTGRIGRVCWTVWRGQDWLAERCRLGVSAITNPEMVLRSSILKELGPMDPSVPYAPDMEISLRVSAVSDVARVGGADQALHREHAGSMSETDGSGTLLDLRARADAFDRAFERVGDRVDESTGLRHDARRALAEDALRYAAAARDGGAGGKDVDALLEFARRELPDSASWPEYRKVQRRRPPSGILRVSALMRRTSRRLRHELYYMRWVVNGV